MYRLIAHWSLPTFVFTFNGLKEAAGTTQDTVQMKGVEVVMSGPSFSDQLQEKKRPGRKVVNEQLKSSVLLLRLVARSHSRDEDKTVELCFFLSSVIVVSHMQYRSPRR